MERFRSLDVDQQLCYQQACCQTNCWQRSCWKNLHERPSEVQPWIPHRRGVGGLVLRADERVRLHGRDVARVHRKLEPASDRDRTARQRQDQPAPAGRRGGAPGRHAVVRLLPRRLCGGELRGGHRGGVLAGMPVPPGGPGTAQGRRPRPAPDLGRSARHPRRPGAWRALPRRSAGLLRPGG